MDQTNQLPAETLARINAIPDAQVREYELDAAYQQLSVHNHYVRSVREFRQHAKPETAEPIWIDIVLAVLLVIGCYVLAAIWDARDVERPVAVQVAK